LELTRDEKDTLWDACDATELVSEVLVTQVLDMVVKLESAIASQDQLGTDDAGLKRVDVIEFDPMYKCRQISEHHGRLQNQIRLLLGLDSISWVENIF
jgi:hypothetical protein